MSREPADDNPPPEQPLSDPARAGRLQRAPGADGYRIDSFADVVKRHGLTMACLAGLCLLTPGALPLLAQTTARALGQPLAYLAGLGALLLFFAYWSGRHRATTTRQLQWVFYLLMISVVEEISFRLVLPQLLAGLTPLTLAQVLSNLLFACIHYFTLRWRLVNCIATFFGGMGLSHLMGRGDLVLVVAVHWLGTFINTPRPPSGTTDGAG